MWVSSLDFGESRHSSCVKGLSGKRRNVSARLFSNRNLRLSALIISAGNNQIWAETERNVSERASKVLLRPLFLFGKSRSEFANTSAWRFASVYKVGHASSCSRFYSPQPRRKRRHLQFKLLQLQAPQTLPMHTLSLCSHASSNAHTLYIQERRPPWTICIRPRLAKHGRECISFACCCPYLTPK